MAEEKNYFWIKIRQDFFTDPYIKLLRRMAGGDTYTIIYLEMLVKSANTNGTIYFQGAGSDIAEELALMLNENVEDVRALLAYLEAKNLITHPDLNQDIYLVATPDLTGSETGSARRVRAFRERQKKQETLQSNTQVTISNDSKSNSKSKSKSNKDILSGSEEPDQLPYKEVIDYLNEKTGSKYRSSGTKTKKSIKARFNEGFSLDDFRTVIDVKSKQWLTDKKMKQYLRPETLFGTKFESYLNENHVTSKPAMKNGGYGTR
ncbi:conserved phage C-terminal domain-containing protein [Leuconostoc mesenteroides]|uniref:conserved phage C-terminal domain-containing protein n=1 Tax=Leuconostoc mesenteroides TaxID=1245 RepID=UPI001CBDB9F3|nr:conserved phage C-terminal domain-containing protein [Leuconostoc mesenteroides]